MFNIKTWVYPKKKEKKRLTKTKQFDERKISSWYLFTTMHVASARLHFLFMC